MAGATSVYAIDNLADHDVIVNTPCSRVVVQENYDSASSPTTDLRQKVPDANATAIKIMIGTSATYTPLSKNSDGKAEFKAGEKAGTIRAVVGSPEMQQIESREI